MSTAAMNWAVTDPRVQSEVVGAARAVLFVLAWHADRVSNLAWPSLATLSRETGLSHGGVEVGLARLIDGGFIENLGSRDRARVRRLLIDAPEEDAATSLPGGEDTAAPPHNLPTSSPPSGDKQGTGTREEGVSPSSSSTGTPDLFDQAWLTPEARKLATELATELLPVGHNRPPDANDADDLAQFAAWSVDRGVTDAALILSVTIDTRPQAMWKNAAAIVAAAKKTAARS